MTIWHKGQKAKKSKRDIRIGWGDMASLSPIKVNSSLSLYVMFKDDVDTKRMSIWLSGLANLKLGVIVVARALFET